MDEAQGLLQCILSSVFVVGIGLFVKLCNILHNLNTQYIVQLLIHTKRKLISMIWIISAYSILIREAPDPCSHLYGKDDEKEEEKLKWKEKQIHHYTISSHSICWFVKCLCHSECLLYRDVTKTSSYHSEHAWGFFDSATASQEAYHHHKSPCCNQDVHTYNRMHFTVSGTVV